MDGSRAIVAISDLHLGRKNNQDSFTPRTDAVRQFAGDLADAVRTHNVGLTVVLNGDVFDLWELVSEAELDDTLEARQAIHDGLMVPVPAAGPMATLAAAAGVKVSRALKAHPEFCRFLKTLFEAPANVVFTFGNHDHQLDNNRVADALKAELEVRPDVAAPPTQLFAARYYLDLGMGFYAEHGDQFAGTESRSPLLDPAGDRLEEATGFFFLRYVWNRLEVRHPDLVQRADLVAILTAVLQLIIHRKGVVREFLGFLEDYFLAVRDEHVPLVQTWYMKLIYGAWRMAQEPDAVVREGEARRRRDWCPVTESDLDAAKREFDNAGLDVTESVAVAEELPKSPEEVPEQLESPMAPTRQTPWLPGSPVAARPAVVDGYVKGLRTRFDAAPPNAYPKLDRNTIKTVTLGHTHDRREGVLFKPGPGPVYFNSGSWTRGNEMVYVWSVLANGQVTSGVRTL